MSRWRFFRIAIWVNIIAFMVVQLTAGDALTGKLELGRYFLNNRGHLTEVSQATFVAAKFWAWATMLSVIILLWKPPQGPKA